MKSYKLFYLLFSITLLALLVVACGGSSSSSQPADSDETPVHPDADSIDDGESLFADELAKIVENLAEEPVTEIQRYEVSNIDANTICDFYAKKLTVTGWKKAGRIDNDTPPAIVEIWTRGQGDNEQYFFVGAVQDPMEGKDLYFVTAQAGKQP